MFKRLLKRLVWSLLCNDVYYRTKQYHANVGRAPDPALVKRWVKENRDDFMDDPHWKGRISFREVIIMGSIFLILIGMLVFLTNF